MLENNGLREVVKHFDKAAVKEEPDVSLPMRKIRVVYSDNRYELIDCVAFGPVKEIPGYFVFWKNMQEPPSAFVNATLVASLTETKDESSKKHIAGDFVGCKNDKS